MESPAWMFDETDRRLMSLALDAARGAAEQGEVPVGAVVARGGEPVATAGNRRRTPPDPAGHAEILVLRQAARQVGDWRLEGCSLYVTLEPCPMCVAACRQARLDLVVYGAPDPSLGACGSVVDLAADPRLGPPIAARGGLLADESSALLRTFFAKRRQTS